MRIKIILFFGGKTKFIKKVQSLRYQSEKRLKLLADVREYLETNRLLTSDNNLLLLELEERLKKEINSFRYLEE